MAVRAKTFIYANAFKGEPELSDIQLTEEDLPALNDGEFLIEALYLSVDPYMRFYIVLKKLASKTYFNSLIFFRPYMTRFPVGTLMIGGQVSK